MNVGNNGYIRFQIAGIYFLAHRAIWAMIKGEWPPCDLDHRDGDRQNNRFKNLRLGPQKVNSKNRFKLERNTSGITGVTWSKAAGKWQAQIGVDGDQVYLGIFQILADAAAARKSAEKQYGYTARHGLWTKEHVEGG